MKTNQRELLKSWVNLFMGASDVYETLLARVRYYL